MITRGTLDGEFHGTPRSVIVATEDPWSETIVPRLIAAGADLNRVYRCDVRDRKGAEIGPVELSVDLDQLRQLIAAHDVALIILDPLTSRLGAGLDTHKDAEV
jgi:hypothetical protein